MIYVFDAKSRAFYTKVRKTLWDKPTPTKKLDKLIHYWGLVMVSWSLHWSSVLTFWFATIVFSIWAAYGDPGFWLPAVLSAIMGCMYWYVLRRIVIEFDLD